MVKRQSACQKYGIWALKNILVVQQTHFKGFVFCCYRPSVTFITPAMVVERHRANGRTRSRPRPDATSCHYTGSIRGQPTSVVAISACDGLVSMLYQLTSEVYHAGMVLFTGICFPMCFKYQVTLSLYKLSIYGLINAFIFSKSY